MEIIWKNWKRNLTICLFLKKHETWWMKNWKTYKEWILNSMNITELNNTWKRLLIYRGESMIRKTRILIMQRKFWMLTILVWSLLKRESLSFLQFKDWRIIQKERFYVLLVHLESVKLLLENQSQSLWTESFIELL